MPSELSSSHACLARLLGDVVRQVGALVLELGPTNIGRPLALAISAGQSGVRSKARRRLRVELSTSAIR